MPLEPDRGPSSLERLDSDWAWGTYQSTSKDPWNLARASHLYRRAGWSANWRQLQQAVSAGCESTVELFLSGETGQEKFYAENQSTVESLLGSGNARDLPAWWLYVLLHTPHSLLEKMTLFWHGHFATSAAKVTDARLMYRQHAILRRFALGKFGPMLTEMAKDPAMLLWLDSATNRKSHPNENFAREVMELFSLGLGHYTEQDIKEAARAFTGWEVRHGAIKFIAYQHDDGEKTVLGQKGRWNGDDVVRILLEQPAAGRFLVRKIFRYLVNETVEAPAALIDPLAEQYRKQQYDTLWLMRKILSSNLFYSGHAMGQKIKAPVEFVVGLIRSLEGTTNALALTDDLKPLGQSLFNPPNVKGWNGGVEWINSSTLVARANLVWNLASGSGPYANRLKLDQLSALRGIEEPARIVQRLTELLLGTTLPDEVNVQLVALAGGGEDQRLRIARIVQAIATLPEFQLA
jgi:hypothetical protein